MKCSAYLLAALMALLPLAASAQEASPPVVYSTYYECDMADEAAADQMVENDFAPILDRHVTEGNLMTWGWLSHNTGGTWRRALYFIAPDNDALLDARAAIIEEIQSELPVQGREFNRICHTHEDYIWRSVAGSQPADEVAQDRPAAGLSIYFECGNAQANRADEIVQESFASILDGLVEEGAVNSWSWLSHQVGGPYTRLLVFDGADHKANLRAVERLGQTLVTQHADAFQEFDAICGGRHQDYMWDITTTQQ